MSEEEAKERLRNFIEKNKEKYGEEMEPVDGIISMNADDMSTAEKRKILDEEYERLVKESEELMDRKRQGSGKHGRPRKPLTISYKMEDFEREYLDSIGSKTYWKIGSDKRCGALGIKVGMIPVWDDWGERHSCTVLYLDSNVVLGHKTKAKHGYDAVQLGAGERKSRNVKKAQLCVYEQLGIGIEKHPPYLVREFRINHPVGLDIPIGTKINSNHFVAGQNVDVAGISKGKGFQGPMKRHNFSGLPASHGVSKSHRAHGSIGQCQDPGKVFKGKKMAGRMGCDRVTVQNLRIIKIDRGRNLLYVRGTVPGNKGTFLEIRDAVKKPLFGTQKVQDSVPLPPLPFQIPDLDIDGSGKQGYELMMPMSQMDPFLPAED